MLSGRTGTAAPCLTQVPLKNSITFTERNGARGWEERNREMEQRERPGEKAEMKKIPSLIIKCWLTSVCGASVLCLPIKREGSSYVL